MLLFSLPAILSAFTLFLAYWIGWIVYARTAHPLAKVPGPWLASVSRTWAMYKVGRGDMEVTQRKLHAIYGPLVRIAPNEVACADPSAIKTIYRTQGALNKTDFYPPWNTETFSKHRDTFTETNDKKHGERRRIVNQMYSLSNVLKGEEYINKVSDIFMTRLGEFADSGKPFNFGEWLQMYTFDVVGELFFGRMFGFLEKSEDHNNWIHSLDALMPLLCVTCIAPSYMRNFVLASAVVIPGSIAALQAIAKINAAAKSCVAEFLAQKDKDQSKARTDILTQLYSIHQEKGDKVDFQIGDIEQESWIALFAGSDTTAIGFRTVFYNLMKSPAAYAKLMEELETAAAEGKLHLPVAYAEASKLPYLCACIKEGLRIHPGVQLTMPRVAPAGGLELCGTFIPEGFQVGMNAAVIHFDTSIFGDDAADYNPDRWLGEDPERITRMDRHMLHFGAGTRTCIGKNISIAEIHKLVPEVLLSFKLELADPKAAWKTRNLWFCKQSGVNARISRREGLEKYHHQHHENGTVVEN